MYEVIVNTNTINLNFTTHTKINFAIFDNLIKIININFGLKAIKR